MGTVTYGAGYSLELMKQHSCREATQLQQQGKPHSCRGSHTAAAAGEAAQLQGSHTAAAAGEATQLQGKPHSCSSSNSCLYITWWNASADKLALIPVGCGC